MNAPAVLDSAEFVVATWLKGQLQTIWPLANDRIAVEFPKAVAWPFIRLNRTGGVPDTDQGVIDHPKVTCQVWTELGRDEQARWISSHIVRLVAARTFRGLITPHNWVENAFVSVGPYAFPDPDTNQPVMRTEIAFDQFPV